jgi:SAM-dependent methyltransferase
MTATNNPPMHRAPGLDTAGQHCGVCGTPVETQAGGRAADPVIVACPECGTGVTVPAPRRDVTSDRLFVEVYGDRRIAMRRQWFLEARRRLEWIGTRIASGTLLEVGCATGELVATAAEAGYEVYGCDTSRWAVERAAELEGAEVMLGTLADWRAQHPGKRVDAVAMFHVLEHLDDPGQLLEQAESVLSECGLLFVEVPNFGSTGAQRDPARWEAAMLEDHFHHFTPGSLSRLLAARGFEVMSMDQLDWRSYESSVAFWWRRLRWLRRGILRPSKDLLRACARAAGSS